MDKVVRNHVVHVVFSDSMDVSEISAEDREMDMRVKTAVKHAIQKAKVCQKPTLFLWFCYLMVVVVFFENRRRVVLPVALLVTVLVSSSLNYNTFIRFYDYSVGLPELVPVTENPVPLILAIAIFILTILSVLSLYKINRKLCIELIILNSLGFGSRFIMGFSATVSVGHI